MEKRHRGIQGIGILIGWFILSLTSVCPGSERDVMRTQGLINPGGNPAAGYVLINETRVLIDKNTQVMNHRCAPISVSELKPKRWVYMEVEKDSVRQTVKSSKIYLLPRYLNPEETKRFPFIK